MKPHLIRPQPQHFPDGLEAGLSQVMAGETVAQRQEAAGHLRHVLPTGQHRPQLLGPRVGPHSPHELCEDHQQLPQVLTERVRVSSTSCCPHLSDVAGRGLVVHHVEDVE